MNLDQIFLITNSLVFLVSFTYLVFADPYQNERKKREKRRKIRKARRAKMKATRQKNRRSI